MAAAVVNVGWEAVATGELSAPPVTNCVCRSAGPWRPAPRGRRGLFHNTLPDEVVERGSALYVLRALIARGPAGHPAGPVPLGRLPPSALRRLWQ